MSSVDFFAASKVLMVAGKGGVGKTTVGASLGLAAAQRGLDVLLIELEGHSNLGAPFGHDQLTYEEQTLLDYGAKVGPAASPNHTTLQGRLRARQITPDSALSDYLQRSEMGRIASRLARSGVVDLVASAAPGIRDVLALGKIRQLSETGSADLIIVDAPAAGHAMSFLLSAKGLQNVVASGPVRQQAGRVLEMLSDPSKCQVTLVTLPEATPVTEVIETAFRIEDELEVNLTPIVVNNTLTAGPAEKWEPLTEAMAETVDARQTKKMKALRSAGEFRLEKVEAQISQLERLNNELPLEQLVLPTIPAVNLDLGSIWQLASELETQLQASQ